MISLMYVTVSWLFIIGLYGIVSSRNLIHLINCLNVVQSSTYILLLMVGYKSKATAPVFLNISNNSKVVDPVVQALTLTDVVVSAVVSALLLGIAIQAQKHFGTLDPYKLKAMSE